MQLRTYFGLSYTHFDVNQTLKEMNCSFVFVDNATFQKWMWWEMQVKYFRNIFCEIKFENPYNNFFCKKPEIHFHHQKNISWNQLFSTSFL